MTQEEQQLLLKDLSARLPYGVICSDSRHGDSRITEINIVDETVYCFDFDEYSEIKHTKPYLRPMSSMTEEEMEDYYKTGNVILDCDSYSSPIVDAFEMTFESFDWLNKKGFDYRGLIPMGLALEAPEDMYENNI